MQSHATNRVSVLSELYSLLLNTGMSHRNQTLSNGYLEFSFLVERPAVAIEDYMLKCMNYYFSHFKSNDMLTVLIEMHLYGVYSCDFFFFLFFLQQMHGMYLQK